MANESSLPRLPFHPSPGCPSCLFLSGPTLRSAQETREAQHIRKQPVAAPQTRLITCIICSQVELVADGLLYVAVIIVLLCDCEGYMLSSHKPDSTAAASAAVEWVCRLLKLALRDRVHKFHETMESSTRCQLALTTLKIQSVFTS